MALTVINEVVQTPKAIEIPTMKEVIAVTAEYNREANSTPWRDIRTGVYGSTPVNSGNRDVDGSTPVSGGSGSSAVCHIPPSPSVLWRNSIGNIWKTATPNFSKSSALNAPIDRTLTN